MDMGQQYVPLTIGTAKPEWKTSAIPHHLFDRFSEPIDGSVVTYRAAVIEAARDIYARGRMPVLVGGSGFYLKSLLFPLEVPDCSLVADLQAGDWKYLAEIDPERAAKIHPSDTYRINRALNVWAQTSKRPSSYQPHYNPPFRYILICLTRDRNELYSRINERVSEMLQMGWQHEVECLIGTEWEHFVRRKKIIGYNDLLDCFNHLIGEHEVISIIQKKTRNYAKRQLTFWRMVERLVNDHATKVDKNGLQYCYYKGMFNLTEAPVTHYIDHLLAIIRTKS